uniref:Uncharacterized protein n=1 Tax=Anguilla anguilla TaxID=7936 RepID=A0A0E9TX66_ANGAN
MILLHSWHCQFFYSLISSMNTKWPKER